MHMFLYYVYYIEEQISKHDNEFLTVWDSRFIYDSVTKVSIIQSILINAARSIILSIKGK